MFDSEGFAYPRVEAQVPGVAADKEVVAVHFTSTPMRVTLQLRNGASLQLENRDDSGFFRVIDQTDA